MSAEIALSNGLICLVDPEDLSWASLIKWHYRASRRTGYATYNAKVPHRRTKDMHTLILEAPPGLVVDHINGDGLDNRRRNLRLVTVSQNGMNQKAQLRSTSKYKGVSWDKARSLWYAHVKANGLMKNLGRFASEDDAARAYNAAAVRLFGEFARINEVP